MQPINNAYLIVCFLLLVLLSSCSQKSEYEQIENVDKHILTRTQRSFTYSPEKNLAADVYFLFRNNNSYPYKNLYIFATVKSSKLKEIDTLQYTLADDYGNWLGTGVGESRESLLLFKKNFKFIKGNEYTFVFQQAMRNDSLKGVEDIGLIISK